jgi:UDP-N-acetylmuramoyl-tripeptide--D-alanyl-D-alanine ligase
MMELGEDSLWEHEQIIQLINRHTWAGVILVGNDFSKVQHSYQYYPDSDAAAQAIRRMNISDAMFLVKGSRSMKMENIMKAFE